MLSGSFLLPAESRDEDSSSLNDRSSEMAYEYTVRDS